VISKYGIKNYAKDWLIFPKTQVSLLSIDRGSNGELYTIFDQQRQRKEREQ
jgi:hypothetical protein